MLVKIYLKLFKVLNSLSHNLYSIKYNLEHFDDNDEMKKYLVKLYLIRDNDELFIYWCYKVYLLLNKTEVWINSKKYLDKKIILNFIWDNWENSFFKLMPNIINDIDEKYKINFDINKLYMFFRKYYIWLAENLSVNGAIEYDEVKNKIKKLLEV